MYGVYGPGTGLALVDVDIEFWNGEKEKKTVHIYIFSLRLYILLSHRRWRGPKNKLSFFNVGDSFAFLFLALHCFLGLPFLSDIYMRRKQCLFSSLLSRRCPLYTHITKHRQ